MRLSKTFALSALVLALSAQANTDFSRPVKLVPTLTPSAFPKGEASGGVEFTTWQAALNVDTVFGRYEQGGFCTDGETLRYGKQQDTWLSGQIGRAYSELAGKLGFSAPLGSRSAFDSAASSSASYRLGATLLDLDYRICTIRDTKGSAYAKLRWELFSTRQQKVIYSTEVEASFSTNNRIPEREFDRNFATAIVGNLLADPKFVEAVRTGVSEQTSKAQALAPLALTQAQVVSGGISKGGSGLLGAVVTIESGTGTGTGFFVGSQGQLLTNHHVVGDAKFVRVKLATGRSLVGEVLRSDRVRDVALVQTESAVDAVLAIRKTAVSVGEDVYALGSPFGEALSGTMTRGIVSSRRVLEGVAFVQSDAAINPGNSGGPLVDASGAVVAISQLGSRAQGINLFIPIEEALERLALTVVPPSEGKPAAVNPVEAKSVELKPADIKPRESRPVAKTSK